MSFVNTKIKCKSCGNENNVAFMLPNTPPSFFPNKSEYVIGGCEKEFKAADINEDDKVNCIDLLILKNKVMTV